MKKSLLLFALLIVSCSVDTDLFLPYEDVRAEGTVLNGLKSKTTELSSKTDVPNYPFDVPEKFRHTLTDSIGPVITYIDQPLDDFSHPINPEGKSIYISSFSNDTPEFAPFLILEGEGNWLDGNPTIILTTKQVRVVVVKANVEGTPSIDFMSMIDKGEYWEMFVIPSENGHYVQIGNYGNSHNLGTPGNQITFWRDAQSSGTISVDESLFVEVITVQVP